MSGAERLWGRLAGVRRLTVETEDAAGEAMTGAGTVEATREAPDVIVFRERGVWRNGARAKFRNVYRWTREANDAVIRLAHMRYGAARPVALVTLVPDGPDRWRAAAPYLCGADRYEAEVEIANEGIVLLWRIDGPRKGRIVVVRYGPEVHAGQV